MHCTVCVSTARCKGEMSRALEVLLLTRNAICLSVSVYSRVDSCSVLTGDSRHDFMHCVPDLLVVAMLKWPQTLRVFAVCCDTISCNLFCADCTAGFYAVYNDISCGAGSCNDTNSSLGAK